MAVIEEFTDEAKEAFTGKHKTVWLIALIAVGLLAVILAIRRQGTTAPTVDPNEGVAPTGYDTYPQYPDTDNIEWREGLQDIKDQLQNTNDTWTDKWKDLLEQNKAELDKQKQLDEERWEKLKEELDKWKERIDTMHPPTPSNPGYSSPTPAPQPSGYTVCEKFVTADGKIAYRCQRASNGNWVLEYDAPPGVPIVDTTGSPSQKAPASAKPDHVIVREQGKPPVTYSYEKYQQLIKEGRVFTQVSMYDKEGRLIQ